MNIAVYSSDKFYIGLMILLTSFFENNNYEKHNVYVFTTDFSDKNLFKINKVLKKKYNQKIIRIFLNEKNKSNFPVSREFSYASFYKMFAFRDLKEQHDRIMCLDADMIVLGSLKDLYYQDLEGKIISACKDRYIHMYGENYLDKIGFSGNDTYYNNGCIVIDLKKYLDEYSVEYYLRWINDNRQKLKYVAQDVVNLLFKGKIREVPYEKYNYQITSWENVDEDIIGNCFILHCLGKIKPWDYKYDGNAKEYAYKAMKKSGMRFQVFVIKIKRKLFLAKRKIKGLFNN